MFATTTHHFTSRVAMLLCASALALSACSSSSAVEGSASLDDGGAAAEAGSSDASSQESAASGATDGGAALSTTASALPGTPIPLADLRVFEPNTTVVRTVPVSEVVDTCSTLSGAALTALLGPLADKGSLNDAPVFPDGELLGARCTYQSDTHVLGVIIGSVNEVSLDAVGLVLPIGSGEVSTASWKDSGVTVVSEDSFGAVTPFAAVVEVDDFGVLVHNAGGTGIDFNSDGEVFAVIAKEVAAGVGSAGPAIPIDTSLNIQTAKPCSFFTASELASFLGRELADEARVGDGGTDCTWGSYDSGVEVRIDLKHVSESTNDLANTEVSPTNDAVQFNNFTAYVLTDNSVAAVDIFLTDDNGATSVSAAQRELAENLASRLS